MQVPTGLPAHKTVSEIFTPWSISAVLEALVPAPKAPFVLSVRPVVRNTAQLALHIAKLLLVDKFAEQGAWELRAAD